jgi:hypothetical protein
VRRLLGHIKKIQRRWRIAIVFMKTRRVVKELYDDVHEEALVQAAIKIQRWWRGLRAKWKFRGVVGEEWEQANASAVKIQAHIRGYLARKHLKEQHAAATIIQAHIRGYLARKHLRKQPAAATTIQRHIRGYLARKHARERLNAIKRIQFWWRGWLGRTSKMYGVVREAEAKNAAARTIQEWWWGLNSRWEVRWQFMGMIELLKEQEGHLRVRLSFKTFNSKRDDH